MTAPKPAIVLDVLTGFLGSGKTTLLRKLLASGQLAGAAVLVNEFAGLPVDQLLLGRDSAPAEAFAGGCLCCAVNGNLRDALLRLISRRADGTAPAISRIVLETSGLSDPAPVAATIVADPALSARVQFGGTVAVADLLNMRETLASQEEAVAQLVMADRILLSKGDLLDETARGQAVDAIRAVNPIAEVQDAPSDGAAADPWLALAPRPSAVRSRIEAMSGSRAHRHHSIDSIALAWPEAIAWPRFATWLSLLLHRHGNKILRLKGFIRIAGKEARGPVLVQTVRHLVHTPEHLPDIPVQGVELAVIAKGLDCAAIRTSFETFMRERGRIDGFDRSSAVYGLVR